MNPQARSKDLIVETIGAELLVFDRERNVAHSLNETAARLWQACDGQRDPDALAAECGIDQPTLALALERLRDVDLLDQPTTAEPFRDAPAAGVSRRAMLRKSVLTGAGIGIAIPVIRSITAPSSALAAGSTTKTTHNQRNGHSGCPVSACSPGSVCRQIASQPSGNPACWRTTGASCCTIGNCGDFNNSFCMSANGQDYECPPGGVCTT